MITLARHLIGSTHQPFQSDVWLTIFLTVHCRHIPSYSRQQQSSGVSRWLSCNTPAREEKGSITGRVGVFGKLWSCIGSRRHDHG